MNAPINTDWTSNMRSARGRWQTDSIHHGNGRDLLLYCPIMRGKDSGVYVSVAVGGELKAGQYEHATPHIGDAVFIARWTRDYAGKPAELGEMLDRKLGCNSLVIAAAKELARTTRKDPNPMPRIVSKPKSVPAPAPAPAVQPVAVYLDPVEPGAAVDPDAIGVEVSWSFGDGDADSVRLRRQDAIDAFARHGFACDIEPQLEPDEALRRARQVAMDRAWLVTRELARPNKDVTRVLGVYVRRDPQAAREGGDGWEMIARVRWDDGRGEFTHMPPEGVMAFGHSSDDREAAHAVAEACRLAKFANDVRVYAINGDVSEALVSACGQAGCISRRPGGGGVYLVLQGERCGHVVALLRDLHASTKTEGRNAWRSTFHYQAQETYRKPLTVASWGQSAEQQITGSVDRLLAELEELVAAGAMRESTMTKRAAEADALLQLAGRCGDFLADKVGLLQSRLAQVRDAFGSAANQDLAAARQLLADVPDAERTQKARAAADERAARLAEGKAKKSTKPADPFDGISAGAA